ncbi:MAG: outer membrane protein assembly factor BamD [Acidobacteriaceae bacterium]|nr:outer membrane protein assembly factor BamD [Acidobacteriaceae bacterium]
MFVCQLLPAIRGNATRRAALLAAVSVTLLSSCFHKKYETPITKNTQQPDKVLFDQAVKDIEHGHYEVARLSLQTLMNTYESSEYLAKAKLAIADSWYREGGSNGMAQAEAEYKDFELFYPNMEESAEAQNRVCQIHYKQMEKSDRDWSQTLRAEDECRQLLVQYPNSKFAPQTAQLLRNIQESLAEHEFVVGNFYWKRDMNPAAANRLNALVDQYPLYSRAGEALYEAGDSYSKMGPRFRKKAGDMFARIVREYPLSGRADDAKKRLEDLELPVPQADRAAYDREKYDLANYKKPGIVTRSTSWLHGGPDMSHAAKSGAPTMVDPKPTIPASVPVPANALTAGNNASSGTGTTDVSATTVSGTSALDNKPDARSSGGTAQNASDQTAQPLPTNRDKELKKLREMQAKKQAKLDKKKKKQEQNSDQPQSQNASQGTQVAPAATPPSAAPGATPTKPNPPQSSNPPQPQ